MCAFTNFFFVDITFTNILQTFASLIKSKKSISSYNIKSTYSTDSWMASHIYNYYSFR